MIFGYTVVKSFAVGRSLAESDRITGKSCRKTRRHWPVYVAGIFLRWSVFRIIYGSESGKNGVINCCVYYKRAAKKQTGAESKIGKIRSEAGKE